VVGASLNPPSQFQWVTDGTGNPKPIISGTAGDGIGEDMQWYNPSRYGLSPFPFMVTYNDWGCSAFEECNHAVFSYLSQDDITYNFWYGPNPDAEPKEHAPYLVPSGFSGSLYFPDAILVGSLDARRGIPGIGLASHCYEGSNPPLTADHRYQYGKGIAFFNNPSRVPSTSQSNPETAWAFAGGLESVSGDSFGPRMFRPKVARNEYGYVPPRRGYPRTWVTYLYYTYTQINKTAGTGCDSYDNALSSGQSIGVSRLTITERR
jgi:hypothetical protein